MVNYTRILKSKDKQTNQDTNVSVESYVKSF